MYCMYGKGAWCESVELKGERKSRTFHGFTMRKNQVFGKDKDGAYILTRIVEESSGCSGVYAEILLWRSDGERGWYQRWERNETTVNAMDLYYKNMTEKHIRVKVTRESRESNVNPLQEVKGQKYFQLLT